MKRFSIVIPLYNKQKHIKRAVDSVLAQTVKDFECIIIDDGSTDKSAEIVKEYTDPRICLIQQKNAGGSAARNRGIDAAQNEYIAFLDADDEWLPDFLKTISYLIAKYPDAGAYATALKKIGIDGKEMKRTVKGIPKSDNWDGLIFNTIQILSYGPGPLTTSSSCVPKSIFNQVGRFPYGVKRYQDTDLWIRIGIKYKVAFSSKICAIYYRNVDNSVSNTHLLQEIPIEKTIKQIIQSENLDAKIIRQLNNILSINIYSNALRYIVANKSRKARGWALKIEPNRLDLLYYKCAVIFLSFLPYAIIKFIFNFSNIKLGKFIEEDAENGS